MSVELPEITVVSVARDAVEITLERGGALLRNCIDPISYADSIRRNGVDIYTNDLGVVNPENSEKIKTASNEIAILRELNEAMQEFELPEFNLLTALQFEFGFTLPPHVDNTFITEGVSAFIPRNHLGEVSLHGDSYFEVTPYEVSMSRVTRRTLTVAGNGLFTEARSTYGSGDMLLLRQDIPNLRKRAKVHSAATSKKRGDIGDVRDLFSLDHVIKQ